MSNLQLFNFNGSDVRIIINENGDPMFLASEICNILEIGNTSQSLSRLDEDEKNTIILNDGIGNPNKSVITESGLYSLVLSSRKNVAKSFKRWVTKEVLPSIRKHGGYLTPERTEELIQNPDLIIQLATNLKQERERVKVLQEANSNLQFQTEIQEKELKVSAPKVEYHDKILTSTSTYVITQIAKELGMSAIRLNQKLKERGVQYHVNGQWVLSHKLQDKGYTKTKTHAYTTSTGDEGSAIQTVWTEKGRKYIHEIMNTQLNIYENLDQARLPVRSL